MAAPACTCRCCTPHLRCRSPLPDTSAPRRSRPGRSRDRRSALRTRTRASSNSWCRRLRYRSDRSHRRPRRSPRCRRPSRRNAPDPWQGRHRDRCTRLARPGSSAGRLHRCRPVLPDSSVPPLTPRTCRRPRSGAGRWWGRCSSRHRRSARRGNAASRSPRRRSVPMHRSSRPPPQCSSPKLRRRSGRAEGPRTSRCRRVALPGSSPRTRRWSRARPTRRPPLPWIRRSPPRRRSAPGPSAGLHRRRRKRRAPRDTPARSRRRDRSGLRCRRCHRRRSAGRRSGARRRSRHRPQRRPRMVDQPWCNRVRTRPGPRVVQTSSGACHPPRRKRCPSDLEKTGLAGSDSARAFHRHSGPPSMIRRFEKATSCGFESP